MNMNKSIASAYAATLAQPSPLDPPCAYCGEETVQGDCDDPKCEANTVAPSPDFTVRDEGTIVLFTAETPEGEDWWVENCQEGITFSGANVVDHRFANDIIRGICDAGFNVDFS